MPPVTTQLIIFGALAGVVLYQLYAVLGRRVGRQPREGAKLTEGSAPHSEVSTDDPLGLGVQLSGLAAIVARDAGFDLTKFLVGARSAYETIVRAFAGGERDALLPLVSAEIMAGFGAAIASREAAGRSETVEFVHPPRADLEKSDLQGDVARLTVRFLAELRRRTKGPEGEGVDDQRTAELWTFERNFKSQDLNWVLVHVGVAEA